MGHVMSWSALKGSPISMYSLYKGRPTKTRKVTMTIVKVMAMVVVMAAVVMLAENSKEE